MSDKTTIVFLGSPAFSVPFLEKLHSDGRFEVLAVITQEDKPSGRKMIPTPTPVKILATELRLPLFQPHRLNKDQGLIEHLEKLKPDFLVVVAFGQILNQKVLNIPKIKSINVHGSILPKYRGASPIEQALLNGDQATGLSIMEMDLQMDTGAVYEIIEESIATDDNCHTLRQKLAAKGSAALPDILLEIKNGQLTAKPQDDIAATYCQKISKGDGLCTPSNETALQIYNKFRAFIIWPGIYLNLKGKQLKLLEIALSDKQDSTSPAPGTFSINGEQLVLGCQKDAIIIKKLQLEGKKPQSAAEFLLGNRHLFD